MAKEPTIIDLITSTISSGYLSEGRDAVAYSFTNGADQYILRVDRDYDISSTTSLSTPENGFSLFYPIEGMHIYESNDEGLSVQQYSGKSLFLYAEDKIPELGVHKSYEAVYMMISQFNLEAFKSLIRDIKNYEDLELNPDIHLGNICVQYTKNGDPRLRLIDPHVEPQSSNTMMDVRDVLTRIVTDENEYIDEVSQEYKDAIELIHDKLDVAISEVNKKRGNSTLSSNMRLKETSTIQVSEPQTELTSALNTFSEIRGKNR